MTGVSISQSSGDAAGTTRPPPARLLSQASTQAAMRRADTSQRHLNTPEFGLVKVTNLKHARLGLERELFIMGWGCGGTLSVSVWLSKKFQPSI